MLFRSTCNGLGNLNEIDTEKLFPNPKLSFKKGMIPILDEIKNTTRIRKQIESIYVKYGEQLDTPFEKLNKNLIQDLMYGLNETVDVKLKDRKSTRLNS